MRLEKAGDPAILISAHGFTTWELGDLISTWNSEDGPLIHPKISYNKKNIKSTPSDHQSLRHDRTAGKSWSPKFRELLNSF